MNETFNERYTPPIKFGCHFHKMTKMSILTELMMCHEGIKIGR